MYDYTKYANGSNGIFSNDKQSLTPLTLLQSYCLTPLTLGRVS